MVWPCPCAENRSCPQCERRLLLERLYTVVGARREAMEAQAERHGNLWWAAEYGRLRETARTARDEYYRCRARVKELLQLQRELARELGQPLCCPLAECGLEGL